MNSKVISEEEERAEENNTHENGVISDDALCHELEEDIFVIAFVSPIFSRGFLYASLIFTLQIGILIFFLINQLDGSNLKNFFVAPVKAEIVLIVSQVLALVVTVMTANDIITSLDVFVINYDPEIESDFPHATRTKWFITNFLRMTEGCASVLTALVFIIQSDQVLDLFLNFAAVQFVSEIDNIGFKLASTGYSIFDLTELTNDIKTKLRLKVSITNEKKVRRKQTISLVALFFLIGSFWIIARILQYRNFFYETECHKFEVRFDDFKYDFFNDFCDFNSTVCPDAWKTKYKEPLSYSSFNGFYEVYRENGKIATLNGRPQYYQNGLSEKNAYGEESPAGKIFYCGNIGSWVFGIEGVNKGLKLKGDANDCNWLMKSPETEEYLLEQVSTENWYVWTGSLDISTDLIISCAECMKDKDIDVLDSSCSYHGNCENKGCACEPGWMGSQCETCAACVDVEIFITIEEHNSKWNMTLMSVSAIDEKPLNVYDRPAYYRTHEEGGHVLVYNGSRYVILKMLDDVNQDLETYREYLKTFHSTWDEDKSTSLLYQSLVTSAPMPHNLKWEDPHSDAKVKVSFICPPAQQSVCPLVFNR